MFRKKKLRPEGYLSFKNLLSETIEYATHLNDNVQENIPEVDSDTSEEEDTDDISSSLVADDLNDLHNSVSKLSF